MKATILRATLAVSVALFPIYRALLHARPAQDPAAAASQQTPAARRPSFEVASVKVNNAGLPPAGPMQSLKISGGLFSMTNCSVLILIDFAYGISSAQSSDVNRQLPRGIPSRFDVEARAAGDPTQDRVRLMVQSLLADRFKFSGHFEMRESPIYHVVLSRPGKLGPQLRVYGNEEPCAMDSASAATVAGGFPASCGVPPRSLHSSQSGLYREGARNVGMSQIGDWLKIFGHLDRPVFDGTGLTGNFDFILEWNPKSPHSLQAVQTEEAGPTFEETVEDQLGLKFESATAPVNTFIIDHIEPPSPN